MLLSIIFYYHYWMCMNMHEYAWTNKIFKMSPLLNMSKLWAWPSSEYDRVFNMRVLQNILNMPEYALTELWIYLRFEYTSILNMGVLWICKSYTVLNIPQYCWIYLNGTWICLNMSEFTVIDTILNMPHTRHSLRSIYKLISSYWKMSVFKTLSMI